MSHEALGPQFGKFVPLRGEDLGGTYPTNKGRTEQIGRDNPTGHYVDLAQNKVDNSEKFEPTNADGMPVIERNARSDGRPVAWQLRSDLN